MQQNNNFERDLTDKTYREDTNIKEIIKIIRHNQEIQGCGREPIVMNPRKKTIGSKKRSRPAMIFQYDKYIML